MPDHTLHAGSGLFLTSLVTQQTKSHRASKPAERRVREPKLSPEFERFCRQNQYRLPPAEESEVNFRHSGWIMERTRVRRALVAVNSKESRLERFDNCGGDCVVEWSKSRGRHRLKANYCGDRFCVPCCRARAARARAKLQSLVKGHQPLFITLTIASGKRSLIDALNHLLKSFAKLRRSKLWTGSVTAGAYVIEIKRGSGKGQWHPHIHALCIGCFMPQRELSDAWKQSTGDSFIVDVQRVRQDEKAVGYLGKYITKGWSAEVTRDHDSLVECIIALRGRRLLGTFGEWRNVDLERQDDGLEDWTRVGRLGDIIRAANAGQSWALGVMRSIEQTPLEDSERDLLLDGP